MTKMALSLPTFYGDRWGGDRHNEDYSDFEPPHVPALIQASEDLQITLGSHRVGEETSTTVYIERMPAGWLKRAASCRYCVLDQGNHWFETDNDE